MRRHQNTTSLHAQDCDIASDYETLEYDEELRRKGQCVAHVFPLYRSDGGNDWDFFVGKVTLVRKDRAMWIEFEDGEFKMVSAHVHIPYAPLSY